MTKKKLQLIKEEHSNDYPMNYSLFNPLSGTLSVNKVKLSNETSSFHQTNKTIVGVFYKPSAIILHDLESE